MREQILAEIRRLAAEIGRPPGVRHFQTRAGLAQHLWRGRYWARWSDALREAGLEPNPPFLRPHSDVLFEQLAVATRSFGRFPTGPELAIYRQTHPAPTALTLRCHFGGKSGAISRLRDWAAARPDYADVVALLPSPQALKRDQPGGLGQLGLGHGEGVGDLVDLQCAALIHETGERHRAIHRRAGLAPLERRRKGRLLGRLRHVPILGRQSRQDAVKR